MENHDNRSVSFAIGTAKNLGKAVNETATWAAVIEKFGVPKRTDEKHAVFMKMGPDEKTLSKASNGFIFAAQCVGGRRTLATVMQRNLGTLDIDDPWVGFFEDMESGMHWLSGYECIVLSTRSWTPENPRYRVVFPLSRFILPDEWMPLCRILAYRIDYEQQPMEQVDIVSSRRAQMMFLPTVSADQEFKFLHNRGRLIDPDAMFTWFEEQNV